jgi:hypothetical protein
VWWTGAGVGDRHAPGPRLLAGFSSAATRLQSASNRRAAEARDGGGMSTAQITPPASQTDAAGHAYCLPVVRELPAPVADRDAQRSW